MQIEDEATNEAFAIGPIEPTTVIDSVKVSNLKLTKILTTRNHYDHPNCIMDLVKLLSDQKILVYGSYEGIPGLTNKVVPNETFRIGSQNVKCLFLPNNTTDHMCYHVSNKDAWSCVFTGADTKKILRENRERLPSGTMLF